MNFAFKKIIQTSTLILLLIPVGLNGQAKDTLKVLFVGNSYTYFWNLPQMVNAMAASQQKIILTRQSTAGGVNLRQHWEGDKALQTKSFITSGSWDIVVLQNHSLSSLNNREEFMEYGKKFIKLIRDHGANPLLYVTWARAANPLMQKTITTAYEQLASETGVEIAPVGQLWSRVRKLRPNLKLFDPDGTHPSPIGTYLTACTFYAIITGQSTASISERITTTDKDNEKLYLSIMTKGDADFIQQVVDEYLIAKEQKKDDQ